MLEFHSKNEQESIDNTKHISNHIGINSQQPESVFGLLESPDLTVMKLNTRHIICQFKTMRSVEAYKARSPLSVVAPTLLQCFDKKNYSHQLPS